MNAIQIESAFASNNKKAQLINVIDSKFALRAIDQLLNIFQHFYTLQVKNFNSLEYNLRIALHAYKNINQIIRIIYNININSFSTQKQDTKKEHKI